MRTASEKVKFIESVFGKATVYSKNVDVHCPLPECKDSNKKKLSIRLDDDVNHCWVCGWGARTLLPLLIRFGTPAQVQEYRDKFLPEVVDITKYKEIAAQQAGDEKLVVAKLPSDFRLMALSGRARDPDIKSARRYVENRGLTEKDMWRWRLGTSNERDLRRRVIIPSFDHEGNLNYYTARSIDEATFQRYVNSEGESRNIVFNELNIDWSKRLTIVEGPFDLMKCRGNATCILGSNLSERSALFSNLLLHQTPVTLLLDNDMGGKTQNIARFLSRYSIPVWVATLPNKDPGASTFEEVETAISNAKPWSWNDMVSFKLKAIVSCSLRIKNDKDSPPGGRSYPRTFTSR